MNKKKQKIWNIPSEIHVFHSSKLIMLDLNKQVPVGTTMRPGSRLMVAGEGSEEVEVVVMVVLCGGGQYWWSPWGLGMCYLLISSKIHGRTDRRRDRPTDGRTDRQTDIPSYIDAWTHLKSHWDLMPVFSSLTLAMTIPFQKSLPFSSKLIPVLKEMIHDIRVISPSKWHRWYSFGLICIMPHCPIDFKAGMLLTHDHDISSALSAGLYNCINMYKVEGTSLWLKSHEMYRWKKLESYFGIQLYFI